MAAKATSTLRAALRLFRTGFNSLNPIWDQWSFLMESAAALAYSDASAADTEEKFATAARAAANAAAFPVAVVPVLPASSEASSAASLAICACSTALAAASTARSTAATTVASSGASAAMSAALVASYSAAAAASHAAAARSAAAVAAIRAAVAGVVISSPQSSSRGGQLAGPVRYSDRACQRLQGQGCGIAEPTASGNAPSVGVSAEVRATSRAAGGFPGSRTTSTSPAPSSAIKARRRVSSLISKSRDREPPTGTQPPGKTPARALIPRARCRLSA